MLPPAAAAKVTNLPRAKVEMFAEAATAAREEARKALHAAGDKLLEGTHKMAQEALADHLQVDSQEKWDAAQRFASLLRGMGLVPRAQGAIGGEYAYRRPDLVAEHQREAGTRTALTLREIGANADEWGPGILTASEVVEAAKAYSHPQPIEQDKKKAGPSASVVWDRQPGGGGQLEPVGIRKR